MFFEIEEWEKYPLQQSFPDKQILFSNRKAQDETAQELLESQIISTFIYSTLTKDTLAKFPNLKLIATRSTGFDHIDMAFCKEKGITVVNVPSYGAHSVAEHTFSLILAISRKLIPTIDRSRRGKFEIEDLKGFDLNGKTLGVVGAGKIGTKVIEIALCFGMKVLVYTGTSSKDKIVHENLKYVFFDELLEGSDIITLHVPLTEETHYMINRDNISDMKKGCILINTARGPLIETAAILDALESGILKAAGLDVLEEECFLKEERELLTDEYLKKCDIKTQLLNHVLLDRDDVIYTSHNAFNSDESLNEILHTTVANINSYLEGKPQNVANLST